MKFVWMKHMLKIDWNALKFEKCESKMLKKRKSTWRNFKKILKSLKKWSRLLRRALKKISKWKKKILIKLKSWKKIDELRMTVRKMPLNQSMTKMKFLKITSWTSILIITSLKMLSSSSELKIKHCEISH